MTDFGIKDGNVGVMKGVILGICPEANIVDLSHVIEPQNVREASLVLSRAVPYFPEGSVHLVVVDPGVGTSRRPMAAQIANSFFVGPDNGIITAWLERSRTKGGGAEFVVLDRPNLWLPEVSHVFHGRDIFAPVAAHLAAGVELREVGSPMGDPVLLQLPHPSKLETGIEGEVIHIDHFGNAAANIMGADLEALQHHFDGFIVKVGSASISGVVNTFGDREPGQLVALVGSTGNLIISVVNGNAAQTLRLKLGDPVRVFVSSTAINAQGPRA